MGLKVLNRQNRFRIGTGTNGYLKSTDISQTQTYLTNAKRLKNTTGRTYPGVYTNCFADMFVDSSVLVFMLVVRKSDPREKIAVTRNMSPGTV